MAFRTAASRVSAAGSTGAAADSTGAAADFTGAEVGDDSTHGSNDVCTRRGVRAGKAQANVEAGHIRPYLRSGSKEEHEEEERAQDE
jgi:hypothetical protein